jgi:hypothetical protein
MTEIKLTAGNNLLKEINELEEIIKNCKGQRCDWIEFTFGNGSNRANVCNDKEIINFITNTLIVKNQLKLEQLKEQFSKL